MPYEFEANTKQLKETIQDAKRNVANYRQTANDTISMLNSAKDKRDEVELNGLLNKARESIRYWQNVIDEAERALRNAR